MARLNSSTIFNVPNQITIARIVLSLALFVFLPLEFYWTSLVLFFLAAVTDFADGYWARKYGQVTQLGRIMDPFADKFVICGTFIFLCANPNSLVAAWMVVVIVGRELLVTVLRSFIEEQGGDFSAKWSGKWKMVLQCAAVVGSLWWLAQTEDGTGSWSEAILKPSTLKQTTVALVWGAMLLTIYSGVEYIFAAIRILRKS